MRRKDRKWNRGCPIPQTLSAQNATTIVNSFALNNRVVARGISSAAVVIGGRVTNAVAP